MGESKGPRGRSFQNKSSWLSKQLLSLQMLETPGDLSLTPSLAGSLLPGYYILQVSFPLYQQNHSGAWEHRLPAWETPRDSWLCQREPRFGSNFLCALGTQSES